jgi:hypothetical protein
MKPPKLMLFRFLVIRHASILYIDRISDPNLQKLSPKAAAIVHEAFLQDMFWPLVPISGSRRCVACGVLSLPKVVLSLPAPAGVAMDVIGSLQQTLQSFHYAVLFRIAKFATAV